MRSAQGASEAAASSARPESSARLRRWAARRGRQLLFCFLVLLCFAALIAAAVLLRRGTCLIGLPDVGDPFDVAAMDAGRMIPDDRNAFVYFRRAQAKVRPSPDVPRGVLNAATAVGWSKTDPKVRAWVESNREALELFRKGAGQADGRAHASNDDTAFRHEHIITHQFSRLALLEASRLEEQGDIPGAWAWYRAILQMRAHVMRRGTGIERFVANMTGGGLQQRAASWAADPRTRAIDLRRALDDVIAVEPRPEWEVSALRVDYLLAERELDRPEQFLDQGDTDEQNYTIGGERLPPNLAHLVYATRRFLLREPERSRRILRLAFANWLAHVEVPGERRRRPAVRVLLRANSTDPGVFFYAAGPAAPAAARALSPQDLAAWLVTAPDAMLIQGQGLWLSIGVQERRQHRALLIALAEELYRREHGQPPASEKDLVGTCLDRLPDDGPADFDALTTPTVEAPRPAGSGGSP